MLPQDRRMRPQDDGSYLVIIDGELIGRIYPFAHEDIPAYIKTTKQRQAAYAKRLEEGRWCAKLESSKGRMGYTFETSLKAAEQLADTWLFADLRQREIRTMDDDEIEKLIEFEKGVGYSISQSDAIGTAGKINDHFDTYLKPLYDERRDRERKKGGPG